ncbi:kinase [Staphylococcus phage MVC_VPHSA1]|uniref:Kinase n=1 Tax=Staphylococcus phage MVC_VPHSA1 TaxID=3088876 RepID=A0ABZ0QYS3_9CAUD|nr:kinase [Staphylococcus phage MVC_VPHSA1]
MDNLTIVQEQANTFTIAGAKFKLVNEISVEAMAKMEQIISINEQEIPIPQYMFERLGRGHCGGTWAISDTHVLKVNEIHNRADIDMDRFVDGECLETLQGLPMTPKLYAYSECKQYMVVERLYGMQTGEVMYNMNAFPAKMGLSIVPQLFDWKHWIQQINEFVRESCKRGWNPKDLHGENLMLTREGKIVIVDYGLFEKHGVHNNGIRSKWSFDEEIKEMTRQVKKIAKELLPNDFSEINQYVAPNLCTWEEFQKPIEKEAKEIVKRYSLTAHLDAEGYDQGNTRGDIADFLEKFCQPVEIPKAEPFKPIVIDWGHHRGSIRHIGAAKHQALNPVANAALFQDIRPLVSFHLNDGGVIRELKDLQIKPVEPVKFPKIEFDVDNAVKQLEKAAGGFKALFQNIKGVKNNELF